MIDSVNYTLPVMCGTLGIEIEWTWEKYLCMYVYGNAQACTCVRGSGTLNTQVTV